MSTWFDAEDPQDMQRSLLRQVILWIFWIVLFYAVFNTVMVAIYRDLAIAVCGISFYMYNGFLLFMWFRLDRWTVETASIVVGGGLVLQGIVIALVYPAAAAAAGMVPIVAVAMLLSFHTGRRLLFMIVVAGIASLAIIILSEVTFFQTNSPDWLITFYRVNATPAVAILVLVLLWQFHYRLTKTLAQLRTANYNLHDQTLMLRREVEMRALAEGELEKQNALLEAQNAELERFSYTVSHDLKSPLVTIKGFLGLLREDVDKGNLPGMERDIERIGDAADTMARLLSELLELSRIGRQMNAAEPVNLSELASEAAHLVDGQIEARGVRVEIKSEMPVVQGDRVRLLEVYQNLIDNAVKFMGDQPEPSIEVGAEQCEDEVLCYVRDNGIGIEAEYHDNVFGLFNRLDPSEQGTGIGLALIKRIVEIHGGRIWVESEGDGQGSTFFFTFPLKGTDV